MSPVPSSSSILCTRCTSNTGMQMRTLLDSITERILDSGLAIKLDILCTASHRHLCPRYRFLEPRTSQTRFMIPT